MKKLLTILLFLVIGCHAIAYSNNLIAIDDMISCVIGYIAVWGIAIPLFFEDKKEEVPVNKTIEGVIIGPKDYVPTKKLAVKYKKTDGKYLQKN